MLLGWADISECLFQLSYFPVITLLGNLDPAYVIAHCAKFWPSIFLSKMQTYFPEFTKHCSVVRDGLWESLLSKVFFEDLVLVQYCLPKDGSKGIPCEVERLPNRITVKGEARQSGGSSSFPSKHICDLSQRGGKRFRIILKRLDHPSEVTSRPLKEWLKWDMRQIRWKVPDFLMENLGTKSLMKRFLYQEPTVFGEGYFLNLPFSNLLAISRLCWSWENKMRLCGEKYFPNPAHTMENWMDNH